MEKLNEQFKEWFKTNKPISEKMPFLYKVFLELDWSLQWGVYLEFFDSVGINLFTDMLVDEDSEEFFWSVSPRMNVLEQKTTFFKSRPEAQQAAIKKAFEILEKEIQ